MAHFDKKLSDMILPEYRERHLFTARLRLTLYIGFWVLFFYFYHNVLEQTVGVMFTMTGSFLVTLASFWLVSKNRFLAFALISQIVADYATMTVLIYMTEGPFSPFFTFYFFYAFAAGTFYHYIVGYVLAFCSIVVYGLLLLFMTKWQFISPLILDYGNELVINTRSPGYQFLFAAIFGGFGAYGVRIASYFSQQRERMLESRNKELMALSKMSASIRSTLSLDRMLEKVLDSLRDGLDLDLPVLLLLDNERGKVVCHFPSVNPWIKEAERVLGSSSTPFEIDWNVEGNTVLDGIRKGELVFENDFSKILRGLNPPIPEETIQLLKQNLGFSRLVAAPLVAEGKVVGGIAGFVKTPRIEEQTVHTLVSFSDHAALSLEAAILIDQLKRANKNLMEANQVKSEFLATMSHELRTPLTAIIGFSELLLEGVMGNLGSEQKDSLKEILNNGATLLDMINNLLDMAKIEAGKMTLEVNPFDMNELLKRLVHTISSLVQRKKHRLKLNLAKEVPLVHADEKKIQQVVLNLLSNAIKFTPDGGEINVSLSYQKGRFFLDVEDNGIGIRKENRTSIFDMFQQADSSVTRKHGGTGLGLALAKQFIELHGGEIRLASEYGKGSKFTMVLPERSVVK